MYYFLVLFIGIWFVIWLRRLWMIENARIRIYWLEYHNSLHNVFMNLLLDHCNIDKEKLLKNNPECKKIMDYYWNSDKK